jgi:hypothetical protein
MQLLIVMVSTGCQIQKYTRTSILRVKTVVYLVYTK